MIAHLVFSTLVLALILAAAHALPLRARTRCTLLLLGIAQFFVPAVPSRLLGLEPERGPAMIRIFAGQLTTAGSAPATRVNWIAIVWAAVAALLIVRALAAFRSVAGMIRRATPAQICGVSVLRSREIDTPALAGLRRPVILLPEYAESIDERELHALILHERAHLDRRDNIVAALETLAGALLWFHPLVWWTRRAIAVAREEACDELVVAAIGAGPYVDALGKVCRAAIAPRAATLSCMASNRLEERIRYMNALRTFRTFSHRVVLMFAATFVAAAAVAAGIAGGPAASKTERYTATPSMMSIDSKQLRFSLKIVDRETGAVVAEPIVYAPIGTPATFRTGSQDRAGKSREFFVDVKSDHAKNATVQLRVEENGVAVQTSRYEIRPKNNSGPSDGISLNLKDADIADVAKTFGVLTSKTVELGHGVRGSVTINVTDVPWLDALQQAAAQVGAKAVVDGNTIRITK